MGPSFDAQNYMARNLTSMNFRMSNDAAALCEKTTRPEMMVRDIRVIDCDAVILKAGASERPAVITVGCWP
jgi:hypothetical protein